MTRYITRAWVGDDVLDTSHELNDAADYGRSLTIHETDEPEDTGILDHRGHRIYRMPEKGKLGF